jgi:hypothetical protein
MKTYPLDPEFCNKYSVFSTPKAHTSSDLEWFIKLYIPKGWIGPVHLFDFTPHISEEDFEKILTGEIPSDKKYDKWYIKEAIKDWLKKIGEEK